MTHKQRDIVTKLLAGHYIITSHGRQILYCGNAIPVLRMKHYDMKLISPWLKKDRKGRQTLNLTTIRQLHGNHIAKRLYRNKIQVTPALNPGPRKATRSAPQEQIALF